MQGQGPDVGLALTAAVGSVLDLHGMFESFATFGGGGTLASKGAAAPVKDMDNTRFVKLCKVGGAGAPVAYA